MRTIAMPPKTDMTGQVLGTWKVVEFTGRKAIGNKSKKYIFWLCRCIRCGFEREFQHNRIRNEEKSNLCSNCKGHRNRWDGVLGKIWRDMRYRNDDICPEWRPENDPRAFFNFKACLKRRPSKRHQLKRIDPSIPWQPGNVRWVEMEIHIFQGEEYTVGELAFLADIADSSMRRRLKKLSPEDAVACSKPVFAPENIRRSRSNKGIL